MTNDYFYKIKNGVPVIQRVYIVHLYKNNKLNEFLFKRNFSTLTYTRIYIYIYYMRCTFFL